MNRKILFSLFILVLAAMICFSVLTFAINDFRSEFSGNFTMTDTKGKVSTGKVFIKNDKIRQETTVEGNTNITILRLDKKLSWTLMPGNKKYMEIGLPFDPNHPPKDQNKDYEYETKVTGNETINGYQCQVIQYTYKNQKYGILVQWVAQKLNFAIKYQNKDNNGKVKVTMEYSDIKTGGVDDSLFEIPDGYTKLSIPFNMPGLK